MSWELESPLEEADGFAAWLMDPERERGREGEREQGTEGGKEGERGREREREKESSTTGTGEIMVTKGASALASSH